MKTFPTAHVTLDVDAYQPSHAFTIPKGMHDFQCSQGIYRKPLFEGDNRIVSAGLTPFCELELAEPIIQEDIEQAQDIYSDFNLGNQYRWPIEMFQRVVDEFGGFLPIVVAGLKDGTTHTVGTPCVQVWTDVKGMGELVGWVESTMLPYLWTMSIVATRGRKRKEKMTKWFKLCYPSSTNEEIEGMVQTRFHDFGRRGGSASQLTGIAHLMNWTGTDTMDAVDAAVNHLNNGKKFGACSIPAAAHRSITPWGEEGERDSYWINIEEYGEGVFAVVADSYDYYEGVNKLCEYSDLVKKKGGVLVVRPDSGDPVDCVLYALKKLCIAFGYTENEKGLRVLNNSGVIQGDGIDDAMLDRIMQETINAGYSPINVAFGMGENNHKAVRSETEMGYKTCLVGGDNGGYRSVFKKSNSKFKKSLGSPVAIGDDMKMRKITAGEMIDGDTGLLETHYDGRFDSPLPAAKYDFNETRELTLESWGE